MRYKRYTFTLSPASAEGCLLSEDIYLPILSQTLAEVGFETFEELPSQQTLVAYIGERSFSEIADSGEWYLSSLSLYFCYASELCPQANWNSRWEQESFTPFVVDGCLALHSPQHPVSAASLHELLLEPRCAFGSGAHSTTRMMLSLLLSGQSWWSGAEVLDVGCGTGVLGIASALLGARAVHFVDIDPTAVENTRHNVALNRLGASTHFYTGILDELTLGAETFDLIIANIHRNIIEHDIPHYIRLLHPEGHLMVSGFYHAIDAEYIRVLLEGEGLHLVAAKEDGGWSALLFAAQSPHAWG